MPANMPSLQYRHEAPPRHGAMCRGPSSGGLSGRWVYLSLTSIFSAQFLAVLVILVIFVILVGALYNFYAFLVNSRNFLYFRNSRWGPLRVSCKFS